MKLSKLQKGFTLVELLVVIAVLGILAAAILIAINPIEQMARGRDSSRKTELSSVANALSAYYTTHSNLTGQGYPPAAGIAAHPAPANTNWMDELVYSRDIPQRPIQLNYTNPGSAACGAAAPNIQNNLCYDVNGALDTAIVYVRMESQNENSKCIANVAHRAFFIWSSAGGRAGIVCLDPAVAITTGTALNFIE